MKAEITKVGFDWIKMWESDSFIVYRVVCNLETSNKQISNASHIFTISKRQESARDNRAEVEALRYAADQIGLDLD